MKSQKVYCFCFLFALVFTIQGIVHSLANGDLATLLPSDGCGQVIDVHLQGLIDASLRIAYLFAFLFALSFAWAMSYGGGIKFLAVAAIASISTFVAGGITNLYFHEHLTACDMFFMRSDAPTLNFGVTVLLLVLTISGLVRATKFRK